MAFEINREDFWSEYHQQFGAANQSVTDGLNAILDQICPDETCWDNFNQIAYALATFKWETAGTFQPITERGATSYFSKYDAGTEIGNRLGNSQAGDGFLFRGRGYVQVTGRANYVKDGALLGIDLAGDPDQALQPAVAYKIASMGMKQGWFTGHRLSQYIATGSTPDYVSARRIINGQDHAQDIANIAQKFEAVLKAASNSESDVAVTGA